jgi:hypothetical protein
VTYTAHNPRLLYNAISARLASETGRSIGDAVAPEGADKPYAVVYPLTDGLGEGPLSDPHQVIDQVFQVSCVGHSMDSAQVLQHAVRSAILGWTPTVSGFGTFPIHLDSGSGVLRDDDVRPPVYFTSDRFTARLSG